MWTDLHTDVVGQFTADGTALSGSTTYDPLGKVLATLGMVGNLGYQSEWTDAFTGRVNMLARWYNTDTGQFDTRDTADLSPVPNSVAANRFAYADDNPLTMTDPTGHKSFRDRLRGAGRAIGGAARAVGSAAATAWNTVTSWVSDGWNYVDDALRVGRDWIVDKAKKAVDTVAKKVEQGRKYVAKKVNQVKQHVKKTVKNAVRTGKAVVAKTQRAVTKAADQVRDAYREAENWIKEHKAEIAGFLVGAVVGVACGLAIGWTGVGAVACGALAGAAGSMVTGAMKGHTGWDLVKDGLIGAASGALFGGVFSVAGQAIGAGVRGLIGGVGLRGALGATGKAVGNEVGDIVGGRITGGLVGGMLRGGAPKGSGIRGGGRSAEPEPGRPSSGRGDGGSCPVHSFDPSTKVLMADGSTRPIKDVGVGDKVAATDPKAGTTAAKPVTALHLNRDTDLTDVTVTSRTGGKGATATLKTTQHHPFWNRTLGRWVLAAALIVGHVLLAPDGSTETVVAVRNHAGAQDMRDLTVADIHTYYVVAGTTPVLVHNCGGARFEVDSNGVAKDLDNTVYRVLRDEEDVALGLHPKDPDGNVDIGEFVRNGSAEGFASQWIATTRSLRVAQRWASRSGTRIAEINLQMVSGKVVDLTTPQARNYWLLEWKARGYAMGSHEVDIEGSIPASAIIGLLGL